MPLTCVTITGADDETDPRELLELSDVYPFVEWGILIGSVVGPRFPAMDWIRRLAMCKHQNPLLRMSLHVCGKFLRELLRGDSPSLVELGFDLYSFDRVQLNWHGHPIAPNGVELITGAISDLGLKHLARPPGHWNPELIYQLDGVNDALLTRSQSTPIFRCTGLFDRSHGAGVVPDVWPKALKDIHCGWSGGLGPENLSHELPRIAAQADPARNFWIDMETRVRTDDGLALDLARVRECLAIAEPFTAGVLTGGQS